MKTVLLMRHAKSSWKDSSLSDHDRPLNKRGKRAAPRMGRLLVDQDLVPDAAICSTARRASDTLALLQTTCPIEGLVTHSRAIYHADVTTYLKHLSDLSDAVNRAIVIGHNPDMSYALSVLCGAHEHMTTAAIAAINFKIESWGEILDEPEGELSGFWKPRDFKY